MQTRFLDAHTHMQLPSYDADREAVMGRACAAGVSMVNVGTQAETSRAAIALAEGNDDMWATIGFHPSHCNKAWHHDSDEQASPVQEVFDAEVFRKLAAHPKVVAIGECGLDYFRLSEDAEKDKVAQRNVFISQIELAKEVRKPLMIHCRDAFFDLIEILAVRGRELGTSPGIIHFFTGTSDDATRLLAMGFAFTFGGAITFPARKGKPAGDYDEIVKILPLDEILSETDAPYVAPVPHRGERNEPAYVIDVVKRLAELKNVSANRMAEQIWTNARRIFKI